MIHELQSCDFGGGMLIWNMAETLIIYRNYGNTLV